MAKILVLALFVLLGAAHHADAQTSSCDFETARSAALAQALSTDVAVPDRAVVPYREYLRQSSGAMIPRDLRGYRRVQIPLWFLNTATCEVSQVLIERKIENGRPVLENRTPGAEVDIEEGPHGKIWNGYNTPFYVPDEPELVILLNAWLPAGQTEPVHYSPFSFKLREFFSGLASRGLEHYRNDAREALADLRNRGTPSRTFPDRSLAEAAERWFGNVLPYIPFIEQSDHRWFEDFEAGAEELNPYRRVAEIIGANGDSAYNPTRSSAGAAGLMQIWPPTCERVIRRNYPQAGIPAGCGSLNEPPHSGHIEAIKSAVVHLDITMKALMDAERGTGFLGFITRNFMNLSGPEDFRFNRDLSRGRARGTDVRELQRRLNVPADGIFGSQTERALAVFQRENFGAMFTALEGNPDFLADLGERQVAAYNSSVAERVIPATRAYLDKWDEVHLHRRRGRLQTAPASLVYETVMYLRIYRLIRNNPILMVE